MQLQTQCTSKILHLLGFNHAKLTCGFQGWDFRLTVAYEKVVQKLLA